MSKYINLATDFGFKQESDCTNDIPLFKPKFIHTLSLAAALILAAAAAPAQNNPGAESHSVTVPAGSGLEVSTPTATQGTKVTVKYNGGQYVTGLRITPLATRVTINDKESLRYIALGSETTLRSDIYPDLPEVDKTVAWSASPEGIVDLTANGDGTCSLTAKSAGKATIKVTTVTDKTDEIEIVVFVGAKFTVADGKQVMFAPGNLQYNVTTKKWRFAENQWDYVGGSSGGNVLGSTNTGTAGPWIDLFGWGMWLDPGTFSDGNAKYKASIDPAKTSTDSEDYVSYADGSGNKVTYDGDLNALGNTAMGGGWSTLEGGGWKYLLESRSTNKNNIRYSKATVHSVNGLVILPDEWNGTYSFANHNTINASFAIITDDDWAALESQGAVFLPAAGYRDGTVVYVVGYRGYYWSSSADGSGYAWDLGFHSGYVGPDDYSDRYYGQSVRLVRRL